MFSIGYKTIFSCHCFYLKKNNNISDSSWWQKKIRVLPLFWSAQILPPLWPKVSNLLVREELFKYFIANWLHCDYACWSSLFWSQVSMREFQLRIKNTQVFMVAERSLRTRPRLTPQALKAASKDNGLLFLSI